MRAIGCGFELWPNQLGKRVPQTFQLSTTPLNATYNTVNRIHFLYESKRNNRQNELWRQIKPNLTIKKKFLFNLCSKFLKLFIF